MIVPELKQIQEKYGYLPRPELEALSKRIDKPLHRLNEVITFFPHFRLEPPPAVEVKVCRDMACHLAGAVGCHAALKVVADEFGVAVRTGTGAGFGSAAGGPANRLPRAEVEWVSCLGRCDGAPAVLIELHRAGAPDQYREFVGQSQADCANRLRAVLKAHLIGDEVPADPVDRAPWAWEIDPYQNVPPELSNSGSPRQPYAAVRQLADALTKSVNPSEKSAVVDRLIKVLEISDLRGMGGAGRPAWTKWKEVREQHGRDDETFVICNGDESEPSTFKDREILLRAPHVVIEGMVLGALVVGANRGYVYIRHEYYEQAHAVEHAIEKARALGVVGANVLGTGQDFELEVFESPGGYVCGEQSALIEAIEEHRAEPRNRPPVIEANGLNDRPTLLNNVETFAWVPSILLNGPEWYRDRGLRETPWYIRRRRPQEEPEKGPRGRGLRLFSICGDLNRPGVYEAPVGISLGELIDRAGGMRNGWPILACALSGPSGGFVPGVLRAEDLPPRTRDVLPPGSATLDIRELPLDKAEFDRLGLLLGAGILIVADIPGRRMLDLALNATQFFRNESCGKCVPCRIGTQKLVTIGDKLVTTPVTNPVEREQLASLIGELQSVMEQTSICSLGTSAPKPLASLLKYDWQTRNGSEPRGAGDKTAGTRAL
jgi:NADH:ubiquinone oxidoreductase subunit F (NADH-binding)/NADH:ubiquinone oxidoreductase subunit E